MNFFRLLFGLLSAEITMTMVIRKNDNGRLCVSTSFTTEKGAACDGLVPFLIRGNPEEMDEGFMDAIRQPAEQVNGLVSNYRQFEAAAKQARENIAKKTTPPANDSQQKEADERKRKEEQKRQDYKTLTADAEKAEKSFRYNTAEALLSLAEQCTDDKKEKAALAKRRQLAEYNRSGLMCADNADDAKAAVEAFKKMQEDRDRTGGNENADVQTASSAPAKESEPAQPAESDDLPEGEGHRRKMQQQSNHQHYAKLVLPKRRHQGRQKRTAGFRRCNQLTFQPRRHPSQRIREILARKPCHRPRRRLEDNSVQGNRGRIRRMLRLLLRTGRHRRKGLHRRRRFPADIHHNSS